MNPYADFVMQVDHHMGELLAAVHETGIAERHAGYLLRATMAVHPRPIFRS